MEDTVKVWRESVTIPTYNIGRPEKNPMFLEKRVYQGSSGVVYPHPVIEKISDEKEDKIYSAVFLENEYIKVMILPELGGRIQMAYDKIKQRHFIYYNQVIKPALVGLTGPWISGGIEFNWPQHHRPSTFDPVDSAIEENSDGSKTVWVNEVERMFRTKGMAGFTLYPGKAYIEIKGKLYNRTPFAQTFLWWANPAVKVNDDYQSIFPPDVYAVFDHGKRDVSSFPIATGTYYKVDYAPGTDISRYKNIPVPTSYMAIASKYDFIGGYEHDTKAGLLHVADHHISPGKKQWTWGHGEFGQAWDRNLTDEDGPYIELMTGMFTDNQPDFSWLQPYEEKTFVQYFMPYAEVGVVKNATKDVIAGVEFSGNDIMLRVYTTSVFTNIKIALLNDTNELFQEVVTISPAEPYAKTISNPGSIIPEEIRLVITNAETNKTLVTYQQEKKGEPTIPSPAEAAKRPQDVESNEQLFLKGLHIEQYRHATYVAKDYYEEALRRDANDIRNNNALGLWYLKRAKFAESEPYFRRAIATLSTRNPNPYDGEPFYNLGWSLKLQGKNEEAFDAFYKSTWNDAWQHAGYLNVARIATEKQDFEEALMLIEKSILKNYHSHTARHAKAFILRKLNQQEEALKMIEESLTIDPFNYGSLFEKYLWWQQANEDAKAKEAANQLQEISRNWVHNFIEYALDYAQAGLFQDASDLLLFHINSTSDLYPMLYYYLGWFAFQQNDLTKATAYFKQASTLNPDYCFPNRIEDVAVLQLAMQLNAADAKAAYYLGNFWYDKRMYDDAIACWEYSVTIDNSFATPHRNLSLAYYNKRNHPEKALSSLEKAFALDTTDARVLMELDQLYKSINVSPDKRLSFLDRHITLVNRRDDLFLERITLLNQTAQYEEARRLILSYQFHPWEGGEGKISKQFLVAALELAKQSLENNNPRQAIDLLYTTDHYPENLGEGKLYGTQENDIDYLKGMAYEMMSQAEEAERYFTKATQGIDEPVQAIFYNDPQPDKIFYQGLAWLKLGEKDKAIHIFNRFIAFADEHINDEIAIDYFAVSLPDLLVFETDLNKRNKIHCLYIKALGYLGLGKNHLGKAESFFDEILSLDKNHQGAIIHTKMLKRLHAEDIVNRKNRFSFSAVIPEKI